MNTLVQEKIEQDTDFQSTLETLDDAEREQAIQDKRNELVEAEYERLRKADELAKNYKIRAEKAEQAAKAKPAGEQTPTKEDDGLSIKDSYALQAAGVPFEDVDEVTKAAKVLNLSIPEALKNDIVIAKLAQLKSFRETEQATNTKPGRPSAKEVSDDKILDDAAKGIIPKPGSKEAERLFFLRRKK